MGLRAHITQRGDEVEITVSSDMTARTIAQIQAIIEHYRSRGCVRISINASPRPLSALELAQNEVLAQARELASDFAIRLP